MRFLFKTSYEQDLTLFGDSVQRNWYAALLVGLLGLPWLFPAYLADLNLVLIYGLCGLSLMVLAGYTGLVSLGHAAFLGIGAYAHVYFVQDVGLPWVAAVADDGRVPRHRHAGLRPHHPGGVHTVGPGDPRAQGPARGQARDLRDLVRHRRGLLLPLSRIPDRRDLAHP